MLQGTHDFVINDNINVEVKTIHDKLTDEEINQSTNTLQKTLSIGYTMNDIKREISFQLVRKKWIDHLNKAINDQKGKIIFISVTQSPKLYDVILFLEEKEMKKSFKYIINRAI